MAGTETRRVSLGNLVEDEDLTAFLNDSDNIEERPKTCYLNSNIHDSATSRVRYSFSDGSAEASLSPPPPTHTQTLGGVAVQLCRFVC